MSDFTFRGRVFLSIWTARRSVFVGIGNRAYPPFSFGLGGLGCTLDSFLSFFSFFLFFCYIASLYLSL